VALELADEPDTTVLLAGGRVRPGELSLIGPETEETFARYNCDTYVMGIAGVDPARGVSEYHREEGSVKRAAMKAADRVIVVADETKLGRVQLVSIAPLSAVNAIVTDGPPDHPALVGARALGVNVVCVPGPGAGTPAAARDEQAGA
jgi:DeoR/GlpR family transcriptional regulator of sugar metabolism